MATDTELIYEISIAQKDLDKQLKGVQKSFDKTFDKIDNSASKATSAGSVFKGMIGAEAVMKGMDMAVDAVSEGIKKIVSETSQLEDATLDWEMLTGSAEEAGVRIKSVYDFANRTPFDTKEVNAAATTLFRVSQGALGAEEDLVRLGDAAKKGKIPITELATTYGRLYSKMKAGDKAFGDEINRMTDAGLVSFKLKTELMSMDEHLLKSEGLKKLNDELDKAKGTMERFSSTISGQLGTLSSTWDQIFAFDDKEMQDTISGSIEGLTEALEDNKDTIQTVLKDIFGVITYYAAEWVQIFSDWYRKFNPELKKMEDQMFTAEANLHQIKQKHQAELIKAQKSGDKEELKTVKDKIRAELKAAKLKEASWNKILSYNSKVQSSKTHLNVAGGAGFDYGYYTAVEMDKIIKRLDPSKLKKNPLTKDEIYDMLEDVSVMSISQTINDAKGKTMPVEFIKAVEQTLQRINNESKVEDYLKSIEIILRTGADRIDDLYPDMGGDPIIPKKPEVAKVAKSTYSGPTGLDYIDQLYPDTGGKPWDEVEQFQEGKLYDTADSRSDAENYYAHQMKIQTDYNQKVLDSREETDKDMLGGLTTMTNSMATFVTNSDAIFTTWSKNSLKSFGDFGQALSQGGIGVASGIESITGGSLGSLIPGLGLASAGFGIISALGSLYDDRPSTNEIAASNSNNKANIVSSGIDKLTVNANLSIYSTYVDSESFDELFTDEIAPRISELVKNVY